MTHRRRHHLVYADGGSAPGKRGALSGHVLAGADAHFAILNGEEDDRRCQQAGEDEADTHMFIIGLCRSTTFIARGATPSTNQAITARTTSTITAITYGIFDRRRRAKSDPVAGGATTGSVVARPQR